VGYKFSLNGSGVSFRWVCLSILKKYFLMPFLCAGFALSTDVSYGLRFSASDSGVLFRCMSISVLKEFFLMPILCGSFAPFETVVG